MGLKKGDIDSGPAQENLKRISANFELELLRLIKTLNLISQSKELYRNQITYIQALTDRYKLRLSDFTIRLLDAGRGPRDGSADGPSGSPFTPPAGQGVSPDVVLGVVEDIRLYLKEISDDIEKHKSEYLGKLDSIYSVYNVELGASQTDLDIKLRELQKELARVSGTALAETAERKPDIDVAQLETPAAAEEKPNPVRTSTPRVDYIGPDPTVDNITAPAPAGRKPGSAGPAAEKKQDAKPGAEAAAGRLRSGHVMGAGLLVMGIILGVIFYDALMRTWGIQDYTGGVRQEAQAPAPVPADEAESPAAPAESVRAQKNSIAAPDEGVITPAQTDEKESAGTEDARSPSAPAEVAGDEAGLSPAGPETQVEQTPENGSRAETYSVVGPGANIRSGPGMGYEVVTQLRGGEEFTATGERRGRWVKVSVPDGNEGWISSKLIREVN